MTTTRSPGLSGATRRDEAAAVISAHPRQRVARSERRSHRLAQAPGADEQADERPRPHDEAPRHARPPRASGDADEEQAGQRQQRRARSTRAGPATTGRPAGSPAKARAYRTVRCARYYRPRGSAARAPPRSPGMTSAPHRPCGVGRERDPLQRPDSSAARYGPSRSRGYTVLMPGRRSVRPAIAGGSS